MTSLGPQTKSANVRSARYITSSQQPQNPLCERELERKSWSSGFLGSRPCRQVFLATVWYWERRLHAEKSHACAAVVRGGPKVCPWSVVISSRGVSQHHGIKFRFLQAPFPARSNGSLTPTQSPIVRYLEPERLAGTLRRHPSHLITTRRPE